MHDSGTSVDVDRVVVVQSARPTRGGCGDEEAQDARGRSGDHGDRRGSERSGRPGVRRQGTTERTAGDQGRRGVAVDPADRRRVARLSRRRRTRSERPVLAGPVRARVGPRSRGCRQRRSGFVLGARRHGGDRRRVRGAAGQAHHRGRRVEPLHDLRRRRRRHPRSGSPTVWARRLRIVSTLRSLPTTCTTGRTLPSTSTTSGTS